MVVVVGGGAGVEVVGDVAVVSLVPPQAASIGIVTSRLTNRRRKIILFIIKTLL